MTKIHKIITVTLLILSILHYTQANLSVYNAAQLVSQLKIQVDQKLNDINFSLANFGQVPYGKSLISAVKLSPQMSDECQFDHLEDDETMHNIDYEDKFMLIQRGNCNFVYKAINAQKLGAKGVIVMDNQTEPFRIVMADNGYGYKVKIPAVFIKHQEGLLLKQLILKVEAQMKQVPYQQDGVTKMKYLDVKLNLDFPNKKTEKVDITLFLEGNNRYSYRFIKNFQKYYEFVKPQVNLKISYNVQPCPIIKAQKLDQMCKSDCYSAGKYCLFNTVHQQTANGQLILAQEMLQYIIFQDYPDKWFAFMNAMDRQCAKISQLNQCSKTVMKSVGMNPDTEFQKVRQSFTNGNGQQQCTILNKFQTQLKGSGATRFPSASINGFLVKGSLTAEYLMSDICNTLERPPPECFPYVDMTPPDFPWMVIVLIVGICTIIFTVAFIIYRRMMRRRIKEEMSGKVNDMVSKYIEFYSERNNRQN